MANLIIIPQFRCFLLFAFLFLHSAVSQNPPVNPPAPPPEEPADGSTPPPTPSTSPSAPVESPPDIPPISTNLPLSSTASPPADLPPSPHSPPAYSPSPSPPPNQEASPPVHPPASEVNHINAADGEDQSDGDHSKDGLSGGKKAGIAFGVIAAACLVGFGGMLYKKRKDNERRARYGYTARSDFL